MAEVPGRANVSNPNRDKMATIGTVDERTVGAYQRNGYQTVNASLRGKEFSASKQETIDKQIASLDTALETTTLNEDTTLFRGMSDWKGTTGLDENTIVGATITDNAFVSTSTDPSVAAKFAYPETVRDESKAGSYFKLSDATSAIIVVQASAGDHALPMKNFTEREVLLPRGRSYRVVSYVKGGVKANVYGTKLKYDRIIVERVR